MAFLITQTTPGQEVEATVLRGEKEIQIPLTLGERPATQATQSQQSSQPDARPGVVSIDDAITTARQAVEATGMMADITATDAQAEQRDSQPVWVVTLESGAKTATVVVDGHTGDVLEISVKSN